MWSISCMNPLCTKMQIPVWSMRQAGLKLRYDKLYYVSNCTICNVYTFIFTIILYMQCTDYLCTEWLMYNNVYTLHRHDHIYVLLYIHRHCIYMIMCVCCCIYMFILVIYIFKSCSYLVCTDPKIFIHGVYRSKHVCTGFTRNQKNCIIPGFEPMILCILTSCLIH